MQGVRLARDRVVLRLGPKSDEYKGFELAAQGLDALRVVQDNFVDLGHPHASYKGQIFNANDDYREGKRDLILAARERIASQLPKAVD